MNNNTIKHINTVATSFISNLNILSNQQIIQFDKERKNTPFQSKTDFATRLGLKIGLIRSIPCAFPTTQWKNAPKKCILDWLWKTFTINKDINMKKIKDCLSKNYIRGGSDSIGYVYILRCRNDKHTPIYKIGYTCDALEKRLKDIRRKYGRDVFIVKTFECAAPMRMERLIHLYLISCNFRRPNTFSESTETEWYYCPIRIIDQICREVLTRHQFDEPLNTFVESNRESIKEIIDSREELGKCEIIDSRE